MLNQRYHIHIICTAHDQPLILDRLAVFFRDNAFLTYDVSSTISGSALYSRQKIEDCDYVIVIVGDNYGTSRKTIVSQMHLSYLGAKAKLKPMMCLLKTYSEEVQLSWQLIEFIRLIEQHSNHIYYYDNDSNFEQLISYAHNEMVNRHGIKTRWRHQEDNFENPNSDARYSENEKSTFLSEDVLTSYSLLKNNLAYTKSFDEKSKKGREQGVINPATMNPLIENDAIETHISATDKITMPISLTQNVVVHYTAQAYEKGNLTDISMSTTITWQQILIALAQLTKPFSNYGLRNRLNRLIADNAEIEIKAHMPNVHAVSRCKIYENDLNQLQQLLVAANWIEIATFTTRNTQQLWNLTFYAKSLHDEQLA